MNRIIGRFAALAVVGILLGWVTAKGFPEWFPITFTANLTSEGTDATGSITAVLMNQQLVVTGTLHDVGVIRGIGIFQADPGESGPQVQLSAVPGSHMNGDYIAPPAAAPGKTISAVFDLTSEQIDDLLAGSWYVETVDRTDRPGIKGQLKPVFDVAEVQFDPEAVDVTVDAFPGVWIARDDTWGFQYYDDGSWTYLDDISEAGETPDPGRRWRLRENILVTDNGMTGSGTCSGHSVWYLESFEDGSLRTTHLFAPSGCGSAGQWWHYERAEP